MKTLVLALMAILALLGRFQEVFGQTTTNPPHSQCSDTASLVARERRHLCVQWVQLRHRDLLTWLNQVNGQSTLFGSMADYMGCRTSAATELAVVAEKLDGLRIHIIPDWSQQIIAGQIPSAAEIRLGYQTLLEAENAIARAINIFNSNTHCRTLVLVLGSAGIAATTTGALTGGPFNPISPYIAGVSGLYSGALTWAQSQDHRWEPPGSTATPVVTGAATTPSLPWTTHSVPMTQTGAADPRRTSSSTRPSRTLNPAWQSYQDQLRRQRALVDNWTRQERETPSVEEIRSPQELLNSAAALLPRLHRNMECSEDYLLLLSEWEWSDRLNSPSVRATSSSVAYRRGLAIWGQQRERWMRFIATIRTALLSEPRPLHQLRLLPGLMRRLWPETAIESSSRAMGVAATGPVNRCLDSTELRQECMAPLLLSLVCTLRLSLPHDISFIFGSRETSPPWDDRGPNRNFGEIVLWEQGARRFTSMYDGVEILPSSFQRYFRHTGPLRLNIAEHQQQGLRSNPPLPPELDPWTAFDATAEVRRQSIPLNLAGMEVVAPPTSRTPREESRRSILNRIRRALPLWRRDNVLSEDWVSLRSDLEFLEASDHADPSLQDRARVRWQRFIDETRVQIAALPATSGTQDRIDFVRDRVIREFSHHYIRDDARLFNVLLNQGGNCQTSTQILFGALTKLGLQPQNGERYALQVFSDHVQLVIWNSQSHMLYDLISGERASHQRGDLYHPALLGALVLGDTSLQSYLLRESPQSSEPSRRPERSLSRGEGELHPSILGSLPFPAPRSLQNFSSGPIPERTEIPVPRRTPPPLGSQAQPSSSHTNTTEGVNTSGSASYQEALFSCFRQEIPGNLDHEILEAQRPSNGRISELTLRQTNPIRIPNLSPLAQHFLDFLRQDCPATTSESILAELFGWTRNSHYTQSQALALSRDARLRAWTHRLEQLQSLPASELDSRTTPRPVQELGHSAIPRQIPSLIEAFLFCLRLQSRSAGTSYPGCRNFFQNSLTGLSQQEIANGMDSFEGDTLREPLIGYAKALNRQRLHRMIYHYDGGAPQLPFGSTYPGHHWPEAQWPKLAFHLFGIETSETTDPVLLSAELRAAQQWDALTLRLMEQGLPASQVRQQFWVEVDQLLRQKFIRLYGQDYATQLLERHRLDKYNFMMRVLGLCQSEEIARIQELMVKSGQFLENLRTVSQPLSTFEVGYNSSFPPTEPGHGSNPAYNRMIHEFQRDCLNLPVLRSLRVQAQALERARVQNPLGYLANALQRDENPFFSASEILDPRTRSYLDSTSLVSLRRGSARPSSLHQSILWYLMRPEIVGPLTSPPSRYLPDAESNAPSNSADASPGSGPGSDSASSAPNHDSASQLIEFEILPMQSSPLSAGRTSRVEVPLRNSTGGPLHSSVDSTTGSPSPSTMPSRARIRLSFRRYFQLIFSSTELASSAGPAGILAQLWTSRHDRWFLEWVSIYHRERDRSAQIRSPWARIIMAPTEHEYRGPLYFVDHLAWFGPEDSPHERLADTAQPDSGMRPRIRVEAFARHMERTLRLGPELARAPLAQQRSYIRGFLTTMLRSSGCSPSVRGDLCFPDYESAIRLFRQLNRDFGTHLFDDPEVR